MAATNRLATPSGRTDRSLDSSSWGRLLRGRHSQLVFARYVAISGLSQCVNLGLFQTLVWLRVPVEAAATASILIATSLHFFLNKYANFRSHERSTTEQLGTYLSVGAASLVLQVSVVSVLTRAFHVVPLVANVAAIAINFPFGFVGHRYFTFGKGIGGAYRAWRADRLAKRPG